MTSLGLAMVLLCSNGQEQGCPIYFHGLAQFNKLVDVSQKQEWKAGSMGRKTAMLGQALVGTPYAANTLEVDPDFEICTVKLDEMDCMTFVESCFAAARALINGKSSPQDLLDEVQRIRYINGRPEGYPSRIHYMGDWIRINAQRGYVANLSPDLPGAVKDERPMTFMSAHPDFYAQLKAHPKLIEGIRAEEAAFSKSARWFVPTSAAKSAEKLLQTGDIVGLTSSTEGLDVNHDGMIVVINGVPHLLHASSVAKKVILDGSLSEYLTKHPKDTGFIAARPLPISR